MRRLVPAAVAASRRPPPGLIEQTWKNESAEMALVADRSLFIESSIKEVRNTAIIGGFLAVLVLFFFLKDLRTTAIIAISIPISLLVTFAPLNLLGVSLNIMSLGGLALGIGMLVDSSIVVLESIFRCREEGDSLETAANRGTLEVKGAVVASTLTTIAVFFPMVFVEGVAGQAFGDLGLAVVISLLAALIVALFLIPMLASRGGLRWTESKPLETHWKEYGAWVALRSDWRAFRAGGQKKRGFISKISTLADLPARRCLLHGAASHRHRPGDPRQDHAGRCLRSSLVGAQSPAPGPAGGLRRHHVSARQPDSEDSRCPA